MLDILLGIFYIIVLCIIGADISGDVYTKISLYIIVSVLFSVCLGSAGGDIGGIINVAAIMFCLVNVVAQIERRVN